MPEDEQPRYTGNRGVGVETMLSFMCTDMFRQRVRDAADKRLIGMSEFMREAIEKSLDDFEKGAG